MDGLTQVGAFSGVLYSFVARLVAGFESKDVLERFCIWSIIREGRSRD